jgi:hypothetical protein
MVKDVLESNHFVLGEMTDFTTPSELQYRSTRPFGIANTIDLANFVKNNFSSYK